MDVQTQLIDVKDAVKNGNVGHARRILRMLYQFVDNIFLASMLRNTIYDINQAKLETAE